MTLNAKAAEIRERATAAANNDDCGGVWAYAHWAEKSNDSGVVVVVDENDQPVSGRISFIEPGDGDKHVCLDTIAACEDDLRGGIRASYISAACPATVLALLDEREALREALDDLQQAEAEYREMHDRHGDGSQAAGRAWDLMRRAGDKARTALNLGDSNE